MEREDESGLDVISNEICSALTATPSGLTRDQLYNVTSAESLQPLVKVLHRLRESGDVINLTGTPAGPYVHRTFAEQIPERKPIVAENAKEKATAVPIKTGIAKVAAVMGSLRPDSNRAHLAYAAYLLHLDMPDAFASYDVLMARVHSSVQGLKQRAAVFAQLADLGYLERGPDRGSGPSMRWNAKRFKYPFAYMDITPYVPSEPKASQPEAVQAVVDVGGIAMAVSEVTAVGIEPVLTAGGTKPVTDDDSCSKTCPVLRVSKLESRVNALTDSMCQLLSEMRSLLSEIQELKADAAQEQAA